MQKKTFLFFPIEVGLAHIARSLGVAEALAARGHRVIFTLPKRKQKTFAKSRVEFVDIPSYVEKDEDMIVKSFSDLAFLRRHVEADLRLIHRYQPDVAVVDYRFSALAAAYITGTKAAYITNGNLIPSRSHLANPGYPTPLYHLIEPMAEAALQVGMRIFLHNLVRIVREHGAAVDLEEWFRSVPYIIPEPEGYFPPRKNRLELVPVGPLTWKGFANIVPDWLSSIRPNGRTVYMTFGGTGFNGRRLVELAAALAKQGYRVIVSTGSICSPDDFPRDKNIHAVRYLPGKEVCRRVDLVICHGGFGTLMEALAAARPVVAIPFNPDQINHANRMQELGLGRSMLSLRFSDIAAIFSFHWHRIEAKSRSIPLEKIVATVDGMLKEKETYRQHFKQFFERYKVNAEGERDAARFLEKFASR